MLISRQSAEGHVAVLAAWSQSLHGRCGIANPTHDQPEARTIAVFTPITGGRSTWVRPGALVDRRRSEEIRVRTVSDIRRSTTRCRR